MTCDQILVVSNKPCCWFFERRLVSVMGERRDGVLAPNVGLPLSSASGRMYGRTGGRVGGYDAAETAVPANRPHAPTPTRPCPDPSISSVSSPVSGKGGPSADWESGRWGGGEAPSQADSNACRAGSGRLECVPRRGRVQADGEAAAGNAVTAARRADGGTVAVGEVVRGQRRQDDLVDLVVS